MKQTSVTDLATHLHDVLTSIRAGEEVQLTEQGRTIATVIPAARSEEQDPYPTCLVPPRRPLDVKRFFRQPRAQDPEGAVLAALLKDREESW